VWDSRPWYTATLARLSNNPATQIVQDLDAGRSVVQAAKDHGVSPAQLGRAARADSTSVAMYEGVLTTLDKLLTRGTPISIVTNLPGWLVRPLLESTGIDKYAAAVATPRPGFRRNRIRTGSVKF